MITITGVNDGMSFSPSPARVQVGQQVRWRNADQIAHTATQDGIGFDTGPIPAGATSLPVTFTAEGTVPYHCSLHPGMVGTLQVTR